MTAWQWPEDAIAVLRQKLESRLGHTVDGWAVGDAEAAEISKPPRIAWLDVTGSKLTRPERSGGCNPAPVGSDYAAFAVQIWDTSKANVRSTIQSLVACARDPEIKDAFQWSRYDWVHADRHKNSWAAIILVTIRSLLVDEVLDVVRGDELAFQGGIIELRGNGTSELVATDTIEPA